MLKKFFLASVFTAALAVAGHAANEPVKTPANAEQCEALYDAIDALFAAKEADDKQSEVINTEFDAFADHCDQGNYEAAASSASKLQKWPRRANCMKPGMERDGAVAAPSRFHTTCSQHS